MWRSILHRSDQSPNPSLSVSSAPNLEDFVLANWDTPIPFDYSSSDDEWSFPSLRSAFVVFPEVAEVSLRCMMNLLRDLSQTKSLFITETFLHKVLNTFMILA